VASDVPGVDRLVVIDQARGVVTAPSPLAR
jgi:hypothetical protein